MIRYFLTQHDDITEIETVCVPTLGFDTEQEAKNVRQEGQKIESFEVDPRTMRPSLYDRKHYLDLIMPDQESLPFFFGPFDAPPDYKGKEIGYTECVYCGCDREFDGDQEVEAYAIPFIDAGTFFDAITVSARVVIKLSCGLTLELDETCQGEWGFIWAAENESWEKLCYFISRRAEKCCERYHQRGSR